MAKKENLTLEDYQQAAHRTAIYPKRGKNLIYTVMGLAGEAGELANKVKKLMRSYGLESGTDIEELIKSPKARRILEEIHYELGDILWYVALSSWELKSDLNTVGIANIDKLSERVKNNTVEGSGDGADRG